MSHHTRIDVLPIQVTVATASPSAWRDGLVAARDGDVLTVVLLDGSVRALSTSAAPGPHEPVAVHPVAEVLAVGSAWYSARALPERDGEVAQPDH
ncbi:nuclease [Cellulomonas sp. URHB0016]